MKVINYSSKFSKELRACFKEAGYGKGYRKEIAERVLMSDIDIQKAGTEYTFNYSLFGESTETDLCEHHYLKRMEKEKPILHINNENYIDFDVWIYDTKNDLTGMLAVYVMVYENKIKATLDRPTKEDYLRFVILAKANRL